MQRFALHTAWAAILRSQELLICDFCFLFGNSSEHQREEFFMKKIQRSLFLILLLLLLAGGGLYFSIQNAKQTPISVQELHLNTLVTVTLYGTDRTELLDGAMQLCDHYEKLFSRTLPESEIYRLNHGEISEVSSETADLIRTGLSYGELSDGAFDISIEPVSSLWDFTSGSGRIPGQKELDAAIALVDYRKVHVDGQTVTFDTPGMGLDLGAIAKGYIADRIKDYLKKEGIRHALINLGGNVLCLGSRPDGTDFRIGVQKPFGETTETLTICPICDQSLVSSGTYERFFRKDGHLYHHILNPRTGYPYDNGLTAVTIRSDSSLTGDALSTTVFALGEEKGLELLNRLPDVEGFVVREDLSIHPSKNFS